VNENESSIAKNKPAQSECEKYRRNSFFRTILTRASTARPSASARLTPKAGRVADTAATRSVWRVA